MLSDQAFRLEAERALEQALRALLPLADQEGFDVDLHDATLQLTFEHPARAKFVVSPHAPTRQIWVSAMSRSYRLAWETGASAFTLEGETLAALVERLALDYIGGPMS